MYTSEEFAFKFTFPSTSLLVYVLFFKFSTESFNNSISVLLVLIKPSWVVSFVFILLKLLVISSFFVLISSIESDRGWNLLSISFTVVDKSLTVFSNVVTFSLNKVNSSLLPIAVFNSSILSFIVSTFVFKAVILFEFVLIFALLVFTSFCKLDIFVCNLFISVFILLTFSL